LEETSEDKEQQDDEAEAGFDDAVAVNNDSSGVDILSPMLAVEEDGEPKEEVKSKSKETEEDDEGDVEEKESANDESPLQGSDDEVAQADEENDEVTAISATHAASSFSMENKDKDVEDDEEKEVCDGCL
jgi:hypothetical protein